MKMWVFRVLAAVVGVGITALAGVRADMEHFGIWFPLIAAAQVFLLAFLGNLVKKWGA